MDNEVKRIKNLFIELKKLSQDLKICHNEFIEEYKKSNDGMSDELKGLIKIVNNPDKSLKMC